MFNSRILNTPIRVGDKINFRTCTHKEVKTNTGYVRDIIFRKKTAIYHVEWRRGKDMFPRTKWIDYKDVSPILDRFDEKEAVSTGRIPESYAGRTPVYNDMGVECGFFHNNDPMKKVIFYEGYGQTKNVFEQAGRRS